MTQSIKSIIDRLNDNIHVHSPSKKHFDGSNAFYLHGGGVLRSLEDLRNAFQSMSDSVYYFHVNGDKNDFANWVQYVFEDIDTADLLRKSETKQHAFAALNNVLS